MIAAAVDGEKWRINSAITRPRKHLQFPIHLVRYEHCRVCRFLKMRTRESCFLLPITKTRNCEPENDSFFDSISNSFGHNSGSNSRKFAKKLTKEPELRFFWNRIRHRSSYERPCRLRAEDFLGEQGILHNFENNQHLLIDNRWHHRFKFFLISD